MRLSVIVCTCNRYDTLQRCLRAVLENDEPPEELIVVDQSDEPPEAAPRLREIGPGAGSIRWTRDSGKGLSRARNRGWRLATGDIVAFTDDDAYVDPGWCAAIRRTFALEGFRTGVAGGRILPEYEGRNPHWQMPSEWAFVLPVYDRGDRVIRFPPGELPAGVSLAVRRELLEAIGGFDENIGVVAGRRIQIYGEDSELSREAMERGYDVVYNPDIRVVHPVPLHRQDQAYFNQRLFQQGATDLYLTLRRQSRRWSSLGRALLRKPAKWLVHELWGRRTRDRVRFLGERAYVHGELYMLVRYGLLGSERFQ